MMHSTIDLQHRLLVMGLFTWLMFSNVTEQVGHFITLAYITPVELKVKFSRDYLHLFTTNSTNRFLIRWAFY